MKTNGKYFLAVVKRFRRTLLFARAIQLALLLIFTGPIFAAECIDDPDFKEYPNGTNNNPQTNSPYFRVAVGEGLTAPPVHWKNKSIHFSWDLRQDVIDNGYKYLLRRNDGEPYGAASNRAEVPMEPTVTTANRVNLASAFRHWSLLLVKGDSSEVAWGDVSIECGQRQKGIPNRLKARFSTNASSHSEPAPAVLPYPRGRYKNNPTWDPAVAKIRKRRANGEFGIKPRLTSSLSKMGSVPFLITVAFSHTVTGFSLSDLNISNGVLSNFNGTGKIYTATVTPTDYSAIVTVDVPAGAATDANSHPTAYADQFRIPPTTPSPPPTTPSPPPTTPSPPPTTPSPPPTTPSPPPTTPSPPPTTPSPPPTTPSPPPTTPVAPTTTPVAPTLTFVRVLATSIVINWQVVKGSGGARYNVHYRQENTGNFIAGPQNVRGTRATLLHLDSDTKYEIQVQASNSAGDSDWSESKIVRTRTLIANDRFSLSLDSDDSGGNQFASSLAVSPDNGSVSIQIFGRNFSAIEDVHALSLRFEYDATEVVSDGFKLGPVISGSSGLGGKGWVHIGMTLSKKNIIGLGSKKNIIVDSLMGTVRFRPTDALSETEIRLVKVTLFRHKGQPEIIPTFLGVTLQASSPGLPNNGLSPDFNRDGIVDSHDFVLFLDVFGSKEGRKKYEARYDLDGNGEIGIPDFLIFVDHWGKVVSHVSRVPVFTSALPILRFVEENTPQGQPIGDPIEATGVMGKGKFLTYSLWGVDAPYFAIDASTGQLETNGAYNFEERHWYSPVVRVRYGKGEQVSVVVGVAIIDVAE